MKSKLIKIVGLAILFFVCLNGIKAQRGFKLEYGAMTGISNYLGDVGGGAGAARAGISDIKMQKTRWNQTGYIKYKFHPYAFARLAVDYLRIEGNDAICDNPGRKYRNLSFKNDIYDIEATIHWLFYSSAKPTGIYRKANTYLGAYLFTGIGGFYHNPQALYQGSWVPLQPLRTEGQTNPYSHFGYCLPFGAGFFVSITHGRKAQRIGVEINWRYTNTDYLDDVSSASWANPTSLNSKTAAALSNRNPELKNQPEGMAGNYGWIDDGKGNNINKAPRGNPSNKDSYISFNITYGIAIKGKYTRSRGRKIRSITF
ncbi:MAG: DUF6089 family protein [Bacteroidota bacterium]